MVDFIVAVTFSSSEFEVFRQVILTDINQFTGLTNGTYYVYVSYANPLGEAFSNVLDFTVTLELESPRDENSSINNNSFGVDGYLSALFSVMMIGAITISW